MPKNTRKPDTRREYLRAMFQSLDEYFGGHAIQSGTGLYRYLRVLDPSLNGARYTILLNLYKKHRYTRADYKP